MYGFFYFCFFILLICIVQRIDMNFKSMRQIKTDVIIIIIIIPNPVIDPRQVSMHHFSVRRNIRHAEEKTHGSRHQGTRKLHS